MKRKYRTWLIFVVLCVAVKMIFVGSNVDEGYGIELAWRIARGDKMLLELWEPHQTSAVFGAILVRLFWLFSGGSNTGIVLYMHVCGIVIQFMTAYFLYRVLKVVLSWKMENFAFCASCIYALCWPKGVIAPEYSNLHNWFTTCCALFFILFMHRVSEKENGSVGNWQDWRYLMFAGVCLSGAVLSYPSMMLLYPVMIVLLCHELKASRLKAILALTFPCMIFAGIFVGYLFSYMSMGQIVKGIAYISHDGAHAAGFLSDFGESCLQICILVLLSGICFGGAYIGVFLLNKRVFKEWSKKQVQMISGVAALVVAFIWQIGIWLFRDEFVNHPQTELFLLCIAATILFLRAKRTQSDRELFYLVIFSMTGFLATILLSNFVLGELVGYLSLAAIGGMGILYKKGGDIFCESNQMQFWERLALTIMSIWVLTLSFGRVWVTSQGGELHTTPLEIRNIQKSGPGMGIITNYMTGHRYNTIAGEWPELVQNGESLLYVGPSSFYYMLGDVVVSAPNTISTPVYDEMMLEYWAMHPERYPDVVFVESCYGDVMYDEESFIMKWLTTEYKAVSIKDYEYIRVYRK